MENKLIIIYDYDGTLAPGSIQEPKLIPLLMPELKKNPGKFWELPNARAKQGNLDGNLMYMNILIEKARERNIALTRDFLRKCGSYSKNFPGVEEWFNRINAYGKEKGVMVEHFIISAGNEELLAGTKIAKFFKEISACKFYFDENGVATEAGTTLNDHAKIKFLEHTREPDNYDEDDGEHVKVPYANMIYIGDGYTDLPAMRQITLNGGLAFAVYSNEDNRKKMALQKEKNIVSGLFPTSSCYIRGSDLEKRVFKEIERISRGGGGKYRQLTIFDFL